MRRCWKRRFVAACVAVLGLRHACVCTQYSFVQMRAVRHREASPAMLRGVVFDMDGTLTKPNLDFQEMYQRCGVEPGSDILREIAQRPLAERRSAEAIVDELETAARQSMEAMPGAIECAQWLAANEIRIAVVTRNTVATLRHFLDVLWSPAGLPSVSPAFGRDGEIRYGTRGLAENGAGDIFPPKPDPAALHEIARRWDVPLRDILMVGDSVSHDVTFGRNAGSLTALLEGHGSTGHEVAGLRRTALPDLKVSNLADLPRLLSERYGWL